MTTEREQILALANELNFPALNEWGKDRIEAFYHAARKPLESQLAATKFARRQAETDKSDVERTLVAAQLQIKQYQNALQICLAEIAVWRDENNCDDFNSPTVNEALSQSQDTSALEAMIRNAKNEQQESDYRQFNALCGEYVEKAGEVMRERCIAEAASPRAPMALNVGYIIRALPGVKLEDLK